MFKRFHDVDKWEKEWYIALLPAEKCAWDYITSRCDNVGVWIPNFKLAEYVIGESIEWDKFAGKCHDNVMILKNGKWWLVDFCRFQYPELVESTGCRPHLSYIALLKKHGLWEWYLYGINTVQDKDSYINTNSLNIKSKKEGKTDRSKLPKYGIAEPVYLSDDEMSKLKTKYEKIYIDQYVKKISLWEPRDGKRPKNDYMTILRWLDKDGIPMIQPKPKCTDCGSVLVDGVCHNPDCARYK